jgi:hypothetical protein
MFMFQKLSELIKSFLLEKDAQPLFNKNDIVSKLEINFNFYNFGKKNKNKIFYVIKRSPGAGLFSNLIYIFNHLEIAKKNSFIPIIDMKNFTTIYNEEKKIDNSFNAWDYYFEKINNYGLSEVYKSKNVIITKDKFFKQFDNIISNQKFQHIGSNYFKIKKKFLTHSDNYFKKFLHKNTLAVHYRSTSYKTSANHPFPTTHNQTINKIKYLISLHNYEKIFLCTEDKKFYEKMKKVFKNKLYYLDTYRSDKDDAFKIFPRKFHRYKLGIEILLDALIISKCKGFLHTQTNVSEFVKFLDKKKRIKYFTLFNGINTSNEYLASLTWYYKKFAPTMIGGFKNKL